MVAEQGSDGPAEPPRVLVVEDEPGLRAFVSRALQHDGFAVTDVADGQRALEALNAETYDLLVTDVVMPVLDGIALALIAAKQWPDMRILMITGYPAERQRALNLDDLIHAVIAKPFTLQELRRAAQDALGRRPPP